jgi:hypothetical protein
MAHLTDGLCEYENFVGGIKLGQVDGQFEKVFYVFVERIAKILESL